MCLLCERARPQQFRSGGSGGSKDERVLLGLSIAPAKLIDDLNVAATRRFTATDGVLDYYMHAPGGAVAVSGGGFGQQVIQALPISVEDQAYLRSVVATLDSIIDLDFRESPTAAGADVDIFYDTEIELGVGQTTLGLATTSGFGGWELFLNYPLLASDLDYRRYALIHELGHALGLEHPFDGSDGDMAKGISDPSSSSFPEETVMAYRNPLFGKWPPFFTDNDLNALVHIWGAEQSLPLAIDGLALNSLGGRNDAFHGQRVAAHLNGNAGRDVLDGGIEGDVLRGGKDADSLDGFAGDDWLFGDLGDDVIHGGKGSDYLDGGLGRDALWGDQGADVFRLSAGSDLIGDFSAAEGDRIEIAESLSYRLTAGTQGVEVMTALGVTTLLGVELTAFDASMINVA